MRCKKILIIPDRAELSSYTKLADRQDLGFEYNDFFIPKLLDDTEQLDTVIAEYEQMSGMPGYCTLHGAFLDVTVFSDDSLVARASDYRVEQSLTIAKRLGAKGVVFHTNYIANFKTDSYRDSFVKKNAVYWSGKLLKYPDIQIYMENMFDKLGLTARTYHKILKVARTIADLDGCENIKTKHLNEAICYRSINEKFWGGAVS